MALPSDDQRAQLRLHVTRLQEALEEKPDDVVDLFRLYMTVSNLKRYLETLIHGSFRD